jgi:hypothetical protein
MKLLALPWAGIWLYGVMASLLADESLRVGGGFGNTPLDGAVHSTLQAFAGVGLLRRSDLRTGIEIGVLDTSDSGVDDGWVAGVFAWDLGPDANVFARTGVHSGGDAGWLYGAGVGYFIEGQMEVRMELAARASGTGVQFNLAWYPHRSPYP